MAQFTSDNASEYGRKGGQANRKAPTAQEIEMELPRLRTVQDAMERLDLLGRWITAGRLTGSQGSAAVRSCEVWLRGREAELTEEIVGRLRGEVDRLRLEVGQRQPRRLTAGGDA